MYIQDMTHLISKDEPNYYVFNPSMIPLNVNGTEFYLVCYRLAKYDIPVLYHPWKVWDNGYKFFSNPRRTLSLKYRDKLGPRLHHSIKSGENRSLGAIDEEWDSTGLALLRKDWSLVWNLPVLFPDEMNQDCRLQSGGFLTYNVFENLSQPRVTIRQRRLDVNMTDDVFELHLSEESYLVENLQRVEKHCFRLGSDVIYDLCSGPGVGIGFISSDVLRRTGSDVFSDYFSIYGRDNILVSLSTPGVPYKSHYIASGHMKVKYKVIDWGSTPGKSFIESVDMDKVHRHGQYIYMAFFYTLENGPSGWRILDVTPPFIPSIDRDHLPYLLVMPTGLCWKGSDLVMTYGEGDCRAKILGLTSAEVEALFAHPRKDSFYFLSPSVDVKHVGYYHHKNCGDDAFMEVFKHVHHNYHPTSRITFGEQAHLDFPGTVVLGGGDVINDYFTKGLQSLADVGRPSDNVLAVGVGVPYDVFNSRLCLFRAAYIRTKKGPVGYPVIPDIAFMLPDLYGRNKDSKPQDRMRVGIVPIRTYFCRENIQPYLRFVKGMKHFTQELTKTCDVHFIPFCLGNDLEDDRLIIADIVSGLDQTHIRIFEPGREVGERVRNTYNHIGTMDFAICSRYHAHVFCTIQSVPFISLTCGKKCLNYMDENGLSDWTFRLASDASDLPLDFRPDHLLEFFRMRVWDRSVRNKLEAITLANIHVLREFFAFVFPRLLRQCSVHNTILYPPASQLGTGHHIQPSLNPHSQDPFCPSSPRLV